jgi:asparagine synthase (glutamine-hydrolysing)
LCLVSLNKIKENSKLNVTTMCGIFALFDKSDVHFDECIGHVLKQLHHRGPDSFGYAKLTDEKVKTVMVHTRLQINGDSTKQPLSDKENTIFLVINGEIFNWKELEKELGYLCTSSDCEIVIPLYKAYKNDIPKMLRMLKGQFSFVLYDTTTGNVLISRDHIGVTPLYIGKHLDRLVVASEMKAMTKNCIDLVKDIQHFKPREYINCNVNDIFTASPQKYIDYDIYKTQYGVYSQAQHRNILDDVERKLTRAVKRQLEDLLHDNSVQFGVLLSGGLDSSLIAGLVVKLAKKLNYPHKIKTFSIGVTPDVPDLIAARLVADHLGTDHHEFYFSIEEGLESLTDVIWHTETYDSTTIRASTPMFLLTKKIKQSFPNLKVLFSGELSDELLCYLYGANAPSEKAFQAETVDLVSNVHAFDCLRANKTCMAHGIEVRVPFTDEDYVQYILKLHPRWKIFGHTCDNGNGNVIIEKKILRDAFNGFLPPSILYRKKEQFSDGVSGFDNKTNWIDGLKLAIDKVVSQDDLEYAYQHVTYNVPDTKEKLFFRAIFDNMFNKAELNNSYKTVSYWEPKWCETKDPSGRVQTFWTQN